MIVLLTSNYDGGILQFACQMRREMEALYGDVVLFAPDNCVPGCLPDDTRIYRRENSIVPFEKKYKSIAKNIEKLHPDVVFVCDSNLITSRIITELKKNISVVMCVHDVNPHPNYGGKVVQLKDMVKMPYVHGGWRRADKILLLSEHSFKGFKEKYPQFTNKLDVLKLGAHVPNVCGIEPPEMHGINEEYFLFFGRIDKYKGIGNLLKAFREVNDKVHTHLVIAGNGHLTEEEQSLIEKSTNGITLIKRYITDEEMVWLFENAKCLVLPYIEASQSGVLSMSYYFGKKVIVSNLEGLTEFVEKGVTGDVFQDNKELEKCLLTYDKMETKKDEAVLEYYSDKLEWKSGIHRCLKEMV